MRFLNRRDELARLDELVADRAGGLAVVWGRRRVGKTRLLVEWARRDGVYAVPLIDVLGVVSGVALWRIASVSGNTNTNVLVVFKNVMIGADDPQNTYVPTGTDLLTLTLASGTAVATPLLIPG